MKKLGLALLFIFITTSAQFEEIIFEKEVNLSAFEMIVYGQVISLGDQNSDGYEDILIWDCERQKASIYLGGNPMSTEPFTEIFIDPNIYPYCCGSRPGIISLDINDDGFNDIVLLLIHFSSRKYIEVYYGGPLLSKNPNIVFKNPQGNEKINWGDIKAIQDFNADGRDELALREVDNTVPGQHFSYYIYNIGAEFDTLEYKVITTELDDNVDLQKLDSGDLNGDGYTDLSLYYSPKDLGDTVLIRTYIAGNSDWDITPTDTFYQSEEDWDITHTAIVNDMNGEGKDDILIIEYQNKYPYYYKRALLFGSLPVDIEEDAGINTQNVGLNPLYLLTGDYNGDGYNDLAGYSQGFGYPGVKVWVGGVNITPDPVKTWQGGEEGFCRLVAEVGDVDGDGVDDICIGQIPYGSNEHCKKSTIYIFKGDTSVVGDTTTSIVYDGIIPTDFLLDEPYPNPFNPTTVISYQLAVSNKVLLTVYDSLGKKVTELVNSNQSAGSYEIKFDADKFKLSSGVYFVRMIVENGLNQVYKESKKLVLMK